MGGVHIDDELPSCLDARLARITVTSLSMFWPEHQTSGIPAVC
jgi:hypothetical protein